MPPTIIRPCWLAARYASVHCTPALSVTAVQTTISADGTQSTLRIVLQTLKSLVTARTLRDKRGIVRDVLHAVCLHHERTTRAVLRPIKSWLYPQLLSDVRVRYAVQLCSHLVRRPYPVFLITSLRLCLTANPTAACTSAPDRASTLMTDTPLPTPPGDGRILKTRVERPVGKHARLVIAQLYRSGVRCTPVSIVPVCGDVGAVPGWV